jgi:hypothetical protein
MPTSSNRSITNWQRWNCSEHKGEQAVGRNKLAPFRQGFAPTPELRKLVPAYGSLQRIAAGILDRKGLHHAGHVHEDPRLAVVVAVLGEHEVVGQKDRCVDDRFVRRRQEHDVA